MAKRVSVVLAVMLLLVFGAGLALLSVSEVQQTGTTAGVNYTFTSGGFRNTSFTALPAGFRHVSSSWLGTSKLDVTCNAGQLTINGQPAGAVRAGDTLAVTSDQQVLVNGTPR